MKANYGKSKMTKADQRKLMDVINTYMADKGLGLSAPDYMGEIKNNKTVTNNNQNKRKEGISNEN